MTAEITKLESPIDVMYLIHKALRVEAARVEQMIERFAITDQLQPFREAFQHWEKTLGYHAAVEDKYMTPSLADLPVARDNEAAHEGLEQRLADIQHYVSRMVGPALATAKTRRHLYGKVVALRIAQDDHLEEEEAFVLPIIRARIPEAQQLEMARYLLIDGESSDDGWLIDWVAAALTPVERQLLTALVAQFREVPIAKEGFQD